MAPTGLLPAAALLLVAATNQSLTGTAFLLLAILWGLYCVPAADKPRGPAVSKALWAAACGLSALALALQLGVAAAVAAGAPGVRRQAVAWVLQLLGFPQTDSLADLARAAGPPLLAMLTSAAQVQAARRRQAAAAPAARAAALRVSSYTNAGVAAGLAAAAACLSHPTLLAAPYAAALAAALWRWGAARPTLGAAGGGRGGGGALLALQAYTAAHLSALYVWQWGLSYFAWLRPAAALLGLFVVRGGGGGQPAALEAQMVAQLGSLVVLFVALAHCVRSSGRAAPPRGLSLVARLLNAAPALAPGEEGEAEGGALRQPLLSAEEDEDEEDEGRGAGSERGGLSWRRALLPATVEVGVAGWTAACGHAGAAAAALCGVALIRPSAIGGAALGAGLAVLLLLPARCARLPRRAARALCGGLLAWALACFAATAVRPALGWSDVADAMGVHAFERLPFAPLLAMFAAAAALAAHARAAADAQGTPLPPPSALAQRLLQRLVAARAGAASPAPPSTPAATPPLAAFGSPLPGDGEQAAADDAWAALRRACLRFLWAAALVAVPAAAFAVGVSRFALLFRLFLGGLLVRWARATAAPRPGVAAAATPAATHRLLRQYTAALLLACYVACVGGLPGFGGVLQPAGAEGALRALGLWRPAVPDMLRLLGLLLLVRRCAADDCHR
jgi:hypothetical protein